MIEDKRLIRKEPHQFNGSRQLMGVNQQVVGQPVSGQFPESANEFRADKKLVIGFVLDNVTNPDKTMVTGQLGQDVLHRFIAKVDPAHDTQDAGIHVGKLKQPAGFLHGLAGLNGNGSVKAQRSLKGLKICGQPVPL